jgi:hypothetical protein
MQTISRSMTKSAVAVAREALRVGRSGLPAYSSRYSRQDYTQPQLFALLALKQFLRTDYRGVVTLLAEWTELREAVGLRKVPHYSTLCYAQRRLFDGDSGSEKGGPPGSAGPASRGCLPPAGAGPAPSTSSTRSRRRPSTPPGSRVATSASTSAFGAAGTGAGGDTSGRGRS